MLIYLRSSSITHLFFILVAILCMMCSVIASDPDDPRKGYAGKGTSFTNVFDPNDYDPHDWCHPVFCMLPTL